MRRHITKLGLISSVIALATISGSAVFALPSGANAHAQSAGSPGYSSTNNPSTNGNGQEHLAAGKLKACQNRQNAINNIIGRIDTRAQNQITLFSTIATRVENFYVSKGKTVSNYSQLVAAVASAKTQAETDLSSMQGNSTFSCSANNPKGMVMAFQGYLKTEITDLKNFRTTVKNLIVGVATANGVKLSSSSQSSTSTGSGNTGSTGSTGASSTSGTGSSGTNTQGGQ